MAVLKLGDTTPVEPARVVAVGKPAENATLGAGGLAGVIAATTGGPHVLALALWAVGALPHVVTWLVQHGGVSGAARSLWRGNQK